MSAQRPEPIAPSLAELLDAERSPTAPEAALARVWARTAAATGAYGPGGGSGGHAGNGHASGPTGGSTGSGGFGAGAGGKILGFGITKAGM
ncbi:MAG TPA: hypothetical protein VH044_14985, partial [Polyangiaceae bacterium]|nr:hypothetical protein [Polyangiaceae bacterium]